MLPRTYNIMKRIAESRHEWRIARLKMVQYHPDVPNFVSKKTMAISGALFPLHLLSNHAFFWNRPIWLSQGIYVAVAEGRAMPPMSPIFARRQKKKRQSDFQKKQPKQMHLRHQASVMPLHLRKVVPSKAAPPKAAPQKVVQKDHLRQKYIEARIQELKISGKLVINHDH